MTTTATAKAVAMKVENLRETYGDKIRLDDLGEIMTSLVAALQKADPVAHMVSHEVHDLVKFIEVAKDEIAAIKPKDMSVRAIPKASSELDAIVTATEKAASTIMDAADQIMEVAGGIDGDESARLMDISTAIFEASGFQDITGQRITKVVATLKHLEERLHALAEAIGDDFVEADEHEVQWTEEGLLKNEREILEGPQLEKEASSQDDIDALLASFD